MKYKTRLLAAATISMACNAVAQEDQRRFKLIPFTDMTPDQRKYADAVMAGPTSATGSAAVVPGAKTIGSPFNVYLRSPVLADRTLRASNATGAQMADSDDTRTTWCTSRVRAAWAPTSGSSEPATVYSPPLDHS